MVSNKPAHGQDRPALSIQGPWGPFPMTPRGQKAQPRPALALAFGLHGFLGVFGLDLKIISVNLHLYFHYLIMYYLCIMKAKKELFSCSPFQQPFYNMKHHFNTKIGVRILVTTT